MQSDTPQGDPRLQRINPTPAVATGFVDPCIVFVETTLKGEVPLVAALLATSSCEFKDQDSRNCIELKEVVAVEWTSQERMWIPAQSIISQCILVSEKRHFSIRTGKIKFITCNLSTITLLSRISGSIRFVGSIRYLKKDELARLHALLPKRQGESLIPYAESCLKFCDLDSPTVSDVKSSLILQRKRLKSRKAKLPTKRRATFLGRLLSSLFKKKKPQPVHA